MFFLKKGLAKGFLLTCPGFVPCSACLCALQSADNKAYRSGYLGFRNVARGENSVGVRGDEICVRKLAANAGERALSKSADLSL
jgi:hypothetical protein